MESGSHELRQCRILEVMRLFLVSLWKNRAGITGASNINGVGSMTNMSSHVITADGNQCSAKTEKLQQN